MSSPSRCRLTALTGTLAGVAVALIIGTVPVASSALAAGGIPAATSATGSAGQKLTVTPTSDLAAGGQKITVTGSGYPTFKGVYVAVCKLPAKGERPTPCGGGADTSGASETSKWISSNAPSYAKGLTVDYGKGGTFSVELWAAPTLPDGQDCRQVACAVVTRADHTRTSDRSQDVLVPVTFASASDDDGAPLVLWAGGGILGVVLIAAVVVVALRRRRPKPSPAVDEPVAETTP